MCNHHVHERITNGVVEGINNKIKLIKRSAYGFRNFDGGGWRGCLAISNHRVDNFRDRVLLTWQFNC